MKKPVLVIMAAGMGSRYGGLKQIDPVDNEGHIIMDFSIFDAKRAGFEKVVFIIKKENEADFREAIGNRLEKYMEVAYAYQDINNIPEGYSVPDGRTKPWGTGSYRCVGRKPRGFAIETHHGGILQSQGELAAGYGWDNSSSAECDR